MIGRVCPSLLLAWAVSASAVVGQDSARLPLTEGARVRVTASAAGGSRFVGTLLAIDKDSVTLRTGRASTGRLTLPLREIQRIEVSVRPKRVGRNALIGAGIGAVVGIVWGSIEKGSCEARGGWFCELAVPAGVIVATPTGALVGAATGGERWEDRHPERDRLGIGPHRGGVGFRVSFGF